MRKKLSIIILMIILALMIPASTMAVHASTRTVTVKVAKKKKTKTVKVTVGDKIKLKVKNGSKTVKAGKLKFKTSKKAVAAVTKKGVITAKKAGTATITVTTKDKKKKVAVKVVISNKKTSATSSPSKSTASVSTAQNVVNSYYELTPDLIEIKEGETASVTLKEYPSGKTIPASQVTWESWMESIATVNNGVIKGLSEGDTIVSAVYNGQRVTCNVWIESAFDASAAKKQIKCEIQKEKAEHGGIAVLLSNHYKYPVAIKGKIDFKDSTGKTVGTDEDNLLIVETGETGVLWFYPPFDEDGEYLEYSDCNFDYEAEKTVFDPAGLDNLNIQEPENFSDGSGFQQTIKNTGKYDVVGSTIYWLFYDGSGNLIGHEYDRLSVDSGKSITTDEIYFPREYDAALEDFVYTTPARIDVYVCDVYWDVP